MAQITVTFESYEDLKEFAEKLLGTKQETAVQSNAVANKVAEKVATPVQAVPTAPITQAAPTVAPVQQPAPVTPVQPPVTAVPTTERTYTLDELANAAMTLMDKCRRSCRNFLRDTEWKLCRLFQKISTVISQRHLEEWGQTSNGTCRKSSCASECFGSTPLAGVHSQRKAGRRFSGYDF